MSLNQVEQSASWFGKQDWASPQLSELSGQLQKPASGYGEELAGGGAVLKYGSTRAWLSSAEP